MSVNIYPNVLVDIALRTLPSMLVAGRNMFCGKLTKNNHTLKYDPKRSPRYTIISLLGLIRAKHEGYEVTVNIEDIYSELLNYINNLSIGDLGLLLWLDNRLGSENAASILMRIRKLLRKYDWHKIIGMELAWLITGLTVNCSRSKGEGDDLADSLVRYFLVNRSANCGLFYHIGKGMRRRFPNFPTQVYSIHALCIRARLNSDKVCGDRAVQAAECLSKLQLSNGGWPWIYNATKGVVVEPFEIYSVHQDAMAPMAFHELEATTGVNTDEIIQRGLNWLYGTNELGACMIDNKTGLIYRSIRRKAPLNRLSLYARIIGSTLGMSFSNEVSDSNIGLNMTCRPYHLGWILEAWCGRKM